MKFFHLSQVEDFLIGGNLERTHQAPIPIWAGFIIEQLRSIMSTQDQINADVAALTDAYNQLVAANTTTAQLIAQQEQQIATLKDQIAAGATVSADDLSGLDDITAKIKATAASTVTAPSVPASTVQAPVVSTPIDVPATTAPTADPLSPTTAVDSSTATTPIADATAVTSPSANSDTTNGSATASDSSKSSN